MLSGNNFYGRLFRSSAISSKYHHTQHRTSFLPISLWNTICCMCFGWIINWSIQNSRSKKILPYNYNIINTTIDIISHFDARLLGKCHSCFYRLWLGNQSMLASMANDIGISCLRLYTRCSMRSDKSIRTVTQGHLCQFRNLWDNSNSIVLLFNFHIWIAFVDRLRRGRKWKLGKSIWIGTCWTLEWICSQYVPLGLYVHLSYP